MQTIITRYLPATPHKGARIKAFTSGGAKTAISSYDYAADAAGNHLLAAQALAKALGWKGVWVQGSLPGRDMVALMAEGKHTPGPWAINRRTPTLVFSRGDDDNNHKAVADTACPEFACIEDQAICEANARLIAAAPDLLEALECVRDRLDAEEWPYVCQKIDAVIAKVTGGAE